MECPNFADYRKSPERWIAIGWDREVSGDFSASLRVEVDNSPGVLAQVAAAIAEAHSNIDGVEYLERDTNVAVIRFSIEVKSRKHLADVIRRTRRLQVVHGGQRLGGAGSGGSGVGSGKWGGGGGGGVSGSRGAREER